MIKIFLVFFFLPLVLFAKPVSLQWDQVEGAQKYELLIEKNTKTIVKVILAQNKWSGDLPFGVYLYQVRGVDSKGRAGEWSQLNPLVVMATETTLKAPIHKKVITLMQNQALQLEWEPIEGVSEYLVEIAKKKEVVLSTTVNEAVFRTSQLPEGIYNWRVTGILSAGKDYPTFSEKKWKTKPSKGRLFQLKYKSFKKVKIIYPLGDQWPTETGLMRFEWESVPGAEAYEIRVTKKFGSEVSQKEKVLISETNSTTVNVGKEGAYSWSVRPITDVQLRSTEDFIAGQATHGDFRLLRDYLTEGNTWLLEVSLLYNQGKYDFTDQNKNLDGSFDSDSITTRVRTEHWLWPNWAVGGGIEATFYNVNSESNQRFSADLFLKRRIDLGLGWYLGALLGAEYRQYPELSFTGAVPSVSELGTYGPLVSVDLSKQFSERWSLRSMAKYYMPLFYMTSGVSNKGSDSNQNINLGAQILYWKSKSFGIAAGGFYEVRSLGYKSANNIRTIGMDGLHFYGSAIFRFE